MSETLYYLAYGSNLHPKRLQARCPSAQWLQTIYLQGYQLQFNCRGSDYSGKGNLIKTEHPQHQAIAAVFALHRDEKLILDEIEGAPYKIEYLQLTLEHGEQECFIYLAHDDYVDESIQPYHWYKELIYWGAKYNKASSKTLAHIASFPAKNDNNQARHNENHTLLTEIIESIED